MIFCEWFKTLSILLLAFFSFFSSPTNSPLGIPLFPKQRKKLLLEEEEEEEERKKTTNYQEGHLFRGEEKKKKKTGPTFNFFFCFPGFFFFPQGEGTKVFDLFAVLVAVNVNET